MKLRFLILFFAMFYLFKGEVLYAHTNDKIQGNTSFTYGEKLTYKIRYSLYFNLNVGEVSFEIKENPVMLNGRRNYHIVSLGKTYRFYDAFFKVRDRHESFIDEQTLLTRAFIRIVREGNYSKDEYTTFHHNMGYAKIDNKQIEIPELTHDMMSALYYARNFDYDNAAIGDSFMVTTLISKEIYHVGAIYKGKENIKTPLGTFKCIKLQPILITGRVFETEDGMMLWVTDDKNRVPVRIESGISVGSIRADLVEVENLRNDQTALLK